MIRGIIRTLLEAIGQRPNVSPVVARVDAALAELEATKGGAVHPIRSIPLDMIADVVVREAGQHPTDEELRGVLGGILRRFDPPRIEVLSERSGLAIS